MLLLNAACNNKRNTMDIIRGYLKSSSNKTLNLPEDMRAYMNDKYDKDLQHQLINLVEEKFCCPWKNNSSIDGSLAHMLHGLEHVMGALYAGLKNLLITDYHLIGHIIDIYIQLQFFMFHVL